MLKFSKESGDYLAQIRNNASEKTGVLEHAFEDQSLPRTESGKIRLIELGTGGGESLRELKSKIDGADNVEIIGIDIIPSLVRSLKKEVGVEGAAADAAHLPFVDGSISAINASAILHEVSSYGTYKNDGGAVYGSDAVAEAFREFNRVLMPHGVLAYRDVLAPIEGMNTPKNVEYNRGSWKLFVDWFMQDFIRSQPQFFDPASVEMRSTEKGFSLNAPAGLQREIQRHYLMLRDYLQQVKADAFGVKMLRSDWLQETEGLKSITFTVEERLLPILDLSGFEMHGSGSGNVYKGTSDQFDKMYDDLIEHSFRGLSGGGKDNAFQKIIDEWREREGVEHYMYGNIADLLKLSVKPGSPADSTHVLFPTTPEDIIVAPRHYYDRYLKQIADQPEKDGKQIIAFKKILRSELPGAIESLANSATEEPFLDNSSLEELRASAL